MRFSAFDLASRLSGWCTGDGTELPKADTWAFSQAGNDLGKMLDQFDRALDSHIEIYQPDEVVFEAPILVVNNEERGTDRLLTIRKLYNLGGHLEFVCRRRGIGCSEVGLKQIKKEATGNPNAEKSAIVAAARKIGVHLPEGKAAEDAADAFFAWLLLLRARCPQLAMRFDQALWGGRAANVFLR